ncbi:hypothetical protein [Carboxylicivirga sp. RSCT41]|uniref:hypothetical protein n=1 Tax=Carboxylicivirga agarovorans TaxID=3417570 RepID=UPI003D3364FF
MKKNVWFLSLLAIFSLVVFQGCEDDVDSNYGTTPVSWMPATDFDGNGYEKAYVEGAELEIRLRFKQFEGNEVQKIVLYSAVIDPVTGEVGERQVEKEFSPSDFSYMEEQLQYYVETEYLIEEVRFANKKLNLTADLTTEKGINQSREVLTVPVREYFPFTIEGIPYFYMYNNTYADAEMSYDADASAGYSALTSVMNFYGFDPSNANFQGELGGDINAHDPDWVASYYVSVWPKIIANNVDNLHRVYINESPYYGGPKTLDSKANGTYAEIDAAIESGQPVIVHGDFMKDATFQHQIVLVGRNDRSFLVCDPAGKWDLAVGGEYAKSETAGEYVSYPREKVYAAIGEDGSVGLHIPVDAE